MMKEELTESTKKRKREIQDLEIERETRRKLQDEVAEQKAALTAMVRNHFIIS